MGVLLQKPCMETGYIAITAGEYITQGMQFQEMKPIDEWKDEYFGGFERLKQDFHKLQEKYHKLI